MAQEEEQKPPFFLPAVCINSDIGVSELYQQSVL